jgi:hypothetical protein
MKRTLPLIITAAGGFVLIVAYFIPTTESWGEKASIWFDVLAAIAFVLGGGNLLKVHLKKISDRRAGWGYSGVTILAFLITLGVGLLKVGVRPSADLEHFGESFVHLPLEALPTFEVDGTIPEKADGAELPASVRRQLTEQNGKLVFRGWMRPNQKSDLLGYQDELEWQCNVEKLAGLASPPKELAFSAKEATGLTYYVEHEALSFGGFMTDEQQRELRRQLPGADAETVLDALIQAATRGTSVDVAEFPAGLDIPLDERKRISAADRRLTIKGPMSPRLRGRLTRDWVHYPVARVPSDAERQAFRRELELRGQPLNDEQDRRFDRALDSAWTADMLRAALNTAGLAQPRPKSACDLLTEMNSGTIDLQADVPPRAEDNVQVSDAQFELLKRFAGDDSLTMDQLVTQLRSPDVGTFNDAQAQALEEFVHKLPTVAERNHALCFELLVAGPLSRDQREFLLSGFRRQHEWEVAVGRLLVASHVDKFRWSGEYNQQGSAFWWIYEYVFKPITATMFALLAFYVASAAFRAFRAKNIEAILLLGTAFIILLGRTFAGVLVTDWIPPDSSFAGLRVENITVFVMSVFNTAGNRAIMIGIALGVASTSLRILLGVDRSYLGSGDE